MARWQAFQSNCCHGQSSKGPHLRVPPQRPSHPLAGRRLIASHKPRAGSFSSRWSPISQRSSKMRSFSAPRKELKKRPYNFPRFEYDTNDDVLFEFWKSRPLIELDIKIRTLENEPFKASAEEARQLRRVRFRVHDDQEEQIERRNRPWAKTFGPKVYREEEKDLCHAYLNQRVDFSHNHVPRPTSKAMHREWNLPNEQNFYGALIGIIVKTIKYVKIL